MQLREATPGVSVLKKYRFGTARTARKELITHAVMPDLQKHMRRFRRILGGALVLCFLISFYPHVSCGGTENTNVIRNDGRYKGYYQARMPAFGLTLFLPADWSVSFSRSRFYQMIATGFGPNKLPVSIEVRSLTTGPMDPADKSRYAVVWYRSAPKNFPTWKFVNRGSIPGDQEGGYHMEGVFYTEKARYRRFGRLRFRHNRAYAVYYTVHDSKPALMRKFFEKLEGMHLYYKPVKYASGGQEKPK